jgi:hypothetical protein
VVSKTADIEGQRMTPPQAVTDRRQGLLHVLRAAFIAGGDTYT